jgi:hypothetical protein
MGRIVIVLAISLEGFMVTEFKEIFSGRQLCQDVKVFKHVRNQLRPHLQGMLVVA